jgi:hypothetical protein
MFEHINDPGQNSLQMAINAPLRILHYILFTVGVIVATPIITYFLAHEHYQAQKVVFEAYNTTVPVDAVIVDFNRPSMDHNSFVDLEKAYRGWRTMAPSESNDSPAFYLYQLPFIVIPMKDISDNPQEKHVWVPNNATSDMGPLWHEALAKSRNAWVWAQLPWAPGGMRLTELERLGVVFGLQSPQGRRFDALRPALAHYSTEAAFDPTNDAFVHNGLLKMAPTKWWDWFSGQEQLHAKASYNYRAYVAAARATSAMRYYAACRLAGIPVDPKKFDRAGVWMKPGLAPFDATDDPTKQHAFFTHYIHVFDGKLPRVMLQLQTLNDETPLHDPKAYAFHTQKNPNAPISFEPGGTINHVRGSDFNTEGFPSWPFATGMHLVEPDTLAYNSRYGRPEYDRADYWTNSKPSQVPVAEEAQDKLMALTTFKLWDTLLRKEGILDADRDIKVILADIQAGLHRDTQFCMRSAHLVYHHKTNLGD